MSDSGDKANTPQAEENIDAVIADSASNTASESEPQADEAKSGGGRALMLVLVIAVLIVAGLTASGQLKPLYESALAKLGDLSDTSTTVTSPEPERALPAVTTQPVTRPAAQPVAQPAVSSEEISTLLSTIDRLRSEMKQMERSQETLQAGLLEQQQMNLQVRLRWITDPASRLPQLQLAWEEISLLPGLNADQRRQATEMHALARKNVQALKQWQDELKKWADALATPVHQNIIPEPEHPWLAWIVNQFQLRQAPTVEAKRLGALREKLLDSARQLALESWPAEGAWQSLHAELLLQIKAMQQQDDEATLELGLPESFADIQADISTLRQTAQAWTRQWQAGGTR